MRVRRAVRRVMCFGIAAAIGAAMLPATPGGAAAPLTKVRYSQGGDSLLFGPIYLARDLHYFEDEGLDVEGAALPAGSSVAAAMVGGSLDVAQTAFPHIVQSYEAGIHLVAFAGIFEQLGLEVVLSNQAMQRINVSPQAPIMVRARALKGLKLGISGAGSSTDTFARTLLRSAGLNPDTDASLVPVGDGSTMFAAFERGTVDGFVYPLPFPEIAESRGLGKIFINAIRGDVPAWSGLLYVVVAAEQQYMKDHPAVILGFTRALGRAMKYIQSNPDDAKQRLRKVFPKIEARAMDLSLDAAFSAYAKSPVMSRKGYETAVQFLNASSDRKFNVPFDAVTNNIFARRTATALGLPNR